MRSEELAREEATEDAREETPEGACDEVEPARLMLLE